MTKRIDKELTKLCHRKRVADSQDATARLALHRQECADNLAGNGYVAVRFTEQYGNRPFTVL